MQGAHRFHGWRPGGEQLSHRPHPGQRRLRRDLQRLDDVEHGTVERNAESRVTWPMVCGEGCESHAGAEWKVIAGDCRIACMRFVTAS